MIFPLQSQTGVITDVCVSWMSSHRCWGLGVRGGRHMDAACGCNLGCYSEARTCVKRVFPSISPLPQQFSPPILHHPASHCAISLAGNFWCHPFILGPPLPPSFVCLCFITSPYLSTSSSSFICSPSAIHLLLLLPPAASSPPSPMSLLLLYSRSWTFLWIT